MNLNYRTNVQLNIETIATDKEIEFLSVGELFSGPGGGGLGASMASLELPNKVIAIQHRWATDYDKDSCQTYLQNISRYEIARFGINETPAVICGDINELDLSEKGDFSKVDGLLFGFPCNDYSIVGESKGIKGKFGPLYKHGVRILNRTDKPKWFVAENVGGITSANDGLAFQNILGEMMDAGYKVVAHKYRFEEYGIPQKRHRVIIVGIREDLGKIFKVPKPTMQICTVGKALSGIPETASHQERTKQSSNVIERLNHILPGQNAWNADLPDHLRLNVPNTQLSHIYRRLEEDQPAYTLTGSGGGGTHMYHWSEPRALTNRERARIQTFPDWFDFSGSKESVRKQIGMAIPPEGAKVVIESLLKTLYDVEYEFVPPNIEMA